MQLTDLSHHQDVGSSCQLIDIGPFRLVVDAGLHPQYLGNESLPALEKIPVGTVDYILLTHCHLDHLGALPLLKRQQPQATILASPPTIMLAGRMLNNSYQIMLKQKAELRTPELPLFGRFEMNMTENAFLPMNFKKSRVFEKNGQELEITFYSSGHVVGASGILLKYKHRKIFFTGDVLFNKQLTLNGADFPEGPFDTIIAETTRGNTESLPDVTRESEAERLIHTINHTVSGNGACLIPAFALGRMQEILAILLQAKNQGKLIDCPIFCSGLGLELVDHFDLISKKTQVINFSKKIITQLGVKRLKETFIPGENLAHAGIYLLGSGMLIEHTPSYLAAAAALEHHENSICFVGYCDPDTPGGRLLTKKQGDELVFRKLNYTAKVAAHINKFHFSGHANREEIIDFIKKNDPRAVVLTHGDPPAREWFEQELYIELGNAKIINPTPLQPELI